MLSQIENPQSICILRLSAIGDVCHAVATVQAIQARWPDAKITWIIGKVERQLLDGLAGVEFVTFDKRAGLKGYRDLRQQLKHQTFDILLHMQVALRASLATLCVKAREKWGFDRARAREGQWLFTNKRIKAQPQAHVAEGFLGFAQAIGVAQDHQLSWNMPIESAASDWQSQQLSDLGRYIVIAPAASKPERNWLPERYAAVANYASQRGLSVVICGGPTSAEEDLACLIESHCEVKPRNLVGQTSLKQLLAVIQKADLVLAPDTGPAHMAVTVGTPVIGLYAHSNPLRTGPYNRQADVVSVYQQVLQQQTGKQSQHVRWGKRIKGKDLMQLIEVSAVISKVSNILARRESPKSGISQQKT